MRFSAALPLALLAATLAQAQPATAPATIDAQSIEGISGLEVTARGGVEFRQDDTAIYTDYLKFNREFGRLEAEGGVRFEQGADRFSGTRLRYNTTDHTGEMEAPAFLLRRGFRKVCMQIELVHRLDGAVPADFAPESTSPLRGAGTSDTAYELPTTDFSGAPRGSPPTIGAFE